MGKRRREAGFSLIEIAIVLVVLGLVLAGLIGPIGTRIEQEERERTRAILEEIKEALYGFAIAQGRLPCPDSNGDGREDPTGGGCASGDVVGNLPWVDLGVPEQDSWGRRFLYRVTAIYADNPDPITPTLGTGCPAGTLPPSQASFALCSDGDITIRSDGVDTSPTTLVASNVVAAVASYGKYRFDPTDAANPPSPNEEENFEDPAIPGDTLGTLVSREYTGGSGQEFDDLVVWVSPLILKNRMIMALKLP